MRLAKEERVEGCMGAGRRRGGEWYLESPRMATKQEKQLAKEAALELS